MPKAHILTALRQASDVLSGETLSSQLKIPRVAVWKHIQQLRQAGCQIEASPEGYRLLHEPDLLFPWMFGSWADRIHYQAKISSTMDGARELARNHCPAFSVVIAEEQTAGRGRLQRHWYSDPGGLYFTLVLRPSIPIAWSARVTLAAALTLARLLKEHYQVPAGLKWPNDILVGERKIAGMLAEMEASGDLISFINLGIGVNINNQPEQYEARACSLRTLKQGLFSRKDFLLLFLERLEKGLASEQLEHVAAAWKAENVTLGRQVRIVTHNQELSGLAEDMDDNGALWLAMPDGTRRQIVYGDCFIQ